MYLAIAFLLLVVLWNMCLKPHFQYARYCWRSWDMNLRFSLAIVEISLGWYIHRLVGAWTELHSFFLFLFRFLSFFFLSFFWFNVLCLPIEPVTIIIAFDTRSRRPVRRPLPRIHTSNWWRPLLIDWWDVRTSHPILHDKTNELNYFPKTHHVCQYDPSQLFSPQDESPNSI